MSAFLDRLNRSYTVVWPRPGTHRLPQRVTEAIERNDAMSELLVKVIQFVVFASWGLLYLAAPQPDPETQSQVPLVVSLYLILHDRAVLAGAEPAHVALADLSFDRRRHGAADLSDLELSYPIRPTGILFAKKRRGAELFRSDLAARAAVRDALCRCRRSDGSRLLDRTHGLCR